MLSLATFHIAHLCNQLNHIALPISMPQALFIKIALKLSHFSKKRQNFRELGPPYPDPRVSSGWGLCSQTPKTALPLRISGYAPV